MFIVDDDTEVRSALRLLFLSKRYSVTTFASAEEFLLQIDPNAKGCLLVDQKLPNMTGLGLLRQLAVKGIHIPSLVITAYRDEKLVEDSRKAGAVDVVRKPLDPETLVRQVAKLMQEC